MANPKYPSMYDNYSHAMGFLALAVEQLRVYDSKCADAIRDIYMVGLKDHFETAFKSMKEEQTRPDSGYQRAAQTVFPSVVDNTSRAPPGLGFGLFPEARARVFEGAENFKRMPPTSLPSDTVLRPVRNSIDSVPKYTIDRWASVLGTTGARAIPHSRTNSSTNAHSTPDFGVIGQRRPSSNMDESPAGRRRTSALTELFQNSEPLDDTVASSPATSGGSSLKPLPTDLGRFFPQKAADGDIAKTNKSLRKKSSSSGDASFHTAPTTQDNEARSPAADRIRQEHSKVPSTWANIAAIPSSSKSAAHFSGHLNGALTKAQTRLNPTRALAPKTVHLPTEPLEAQNRAVWLCSLPPHYTLRDVSLQITEGPVMSILLDDTSPLPGHAACIIFQHADHALAFLTTNNNGEPPDMTGNPLPAAKYRAAPKAIMVPGAPYPADADIVAMGPPAFARRRLKWSRARLFHDVPLRTFKEDVYELVGESNVECFHFYNKGECTVVFSSVKVASVAHSRFQTWRLEKSPRNSDGAMLPSALARNPDPNIKNGRYDAVDVTYVHDFNEAPARLFSQLGGDGDAVRCGGDLGWEGLYGGPVVRAGRP